MAAMSLRAVNHYGKYPILLVILVIGFLAWPRQKIVVKGSSMAPGLLPGDTLLMKKMFSPAVAHSLPELQIARGDVVVFRYPSRGGELYVKRIIGLPGDSIRIVKGRVYVNGSVLVEPYLNQGIKAFDDYGYNFPQWPARPVSARAVEMLTRYVRDNQLVIPDGNWFVLGDNRNNSFDSRDLGFIPSADIVGVPSRVAWSIDPNACSSGPKNAGGCIWNALRWSRLLRPIQNSH
jgi:signal peptidase I